MTFIGRIERGFDFLGYHFDPEDLYVALKTVEKIVERANRLYEQEREAPSCASPLGMHVRRWVGWVESGFGEHNSLDISRVTWEQVAAET